MRISLLVLATVICVFLSLGCTGYNTGEQETEVSGMSAGELYTHITEEDDYKGWSLMPGTGEKDPGQGVHGQMVTIHVSDEALPAFENRTGSLSDGSIIVKEGYNASGELEQLVVMQKRENFAPESNDWFWASYSPGGDVLVEGSVSACINCHSNALANDYIFTGALS
jgi:hypothetical protein